MSVCESIYEFRFTWLRWAYSSLRPERPTEDTNKNLEDFLQLKLRREDVMKLGGVGHSKQTDRPTVKSTTMTAPTAEPLNKCSRVYLCRALCSGRQTRNEMR